MTPIEAIKGAARILPSAMFADPAKAVIPMLAMQLQEAPNQEQKQIGGPAVGTYQFERGGGITGVLTHPTTRRVAAEVCQRLGVPAEADAVYKALQSTDDVLDAAFARLLMWTDPMRLPSAGDVEGAWQLYLRTWRPGAYTRGDATKRRQLRQKWNLNYAKAMEAFEKW